jgi:hypothetical protein
MRHYRHAGGKCALISVNHVQRFIVMAGLVPAIRPGMVPLRMAGTSPAMTTKQRGTS